MNAETELGWRVLVMIYDGYSRAQILAALRCTAEQALAALDAYGRSVLAADDGGFAERPAG